MDAVTHKIFPTAVHVIKTKGWAEHKNHFLDMINNEQSPEYRPRADYYTDYGLAQPWRKVIWD
ncbi:MAG: hypothetical protein P8H03_07975 [Emcibacteraceae bacterium]|nr:hypothetical protein [Emcibacteraceae bacterium]